jgi:hypothetical protein
VLDWFKLRLQHKPSNDKAAQTKALLEAAATKIQALIWRPHRSKNCYKNTLTNFQGLIIPTQLLLLLQPTAPAPAATRIQADKGRAVEKIAKCLFGNSLQGLMPFRLQLSSSSCSQLPAPAPTPAPTPAPLPNKLPASSCSCTPSSPAPPQLQLLLLYSIGR